MMTASIAGHYGSCSLGQNKSWRFGVVAAMLNSQFDLFKVVLVEDVVLDDVLGSVLEVADDTLLWWWWLFWFMAQSLLELELGTLLFGSCILEPDLDNPLLKANVTAKVGALSHGGCLVIFKN